MGLHQSHPGMRSEPRHTITPAGSHSECRRRQAIAKKGPPLEEPGNAPILNIIGEKVALGPQSAELLPLYVKWMNDFEVTRTLAIGLRPMTMEAEQKWWETASVRENDVSFTIYERPNLRPIGNTALHKIDPTHATAEFGIVIGEKDAWGRGYGTEAATLMLDYAFTALGLHNVMLRCYAFNDRARRAYLRAGFREFGRRRECHRLGPRLSDEIHMDCLSTEFDRSILSRFLPEE